MGTFPNPPLITGDPPTDGQVAVYDAASGTWIAGSGGGDPLPSGGTTGQALVKESDADGDVGWDGPYAPLSSVIALGDPPFFGVSASEMDISNTQIILTYGAPTVVGDLFCSLGEDNQTITIDVDCTIQIVFEKSDTCAGASGRVGLGWNGLQQSAWPAWSNQSSEYSVTDFGEAPNNHLVVPFTTPAFKAFAGDSFNVTMGTVLTAGTVLDRTRVGITRLA